MYKKPHYPAPRTNSWNAEGRLIVVKPLLNAASSAAVRVASARGFRQSCIIMFGGNHLVQN